MLLWQTWMRWGFECVHLFRKFSSNNYCLWGWLVPDDNVVVCMNRLTLISCDQGISRKKVIIVFERVLCWLKWNLNFLLSEEEYSWLWVYLIFSVDLVIIMWILILKLHNIGKLGGCYLVRDTYCHGVNFVKFFFYVTKIVPETLGLLHFKTEGSDVEAMWSMRVIISVFENDLG